MTRWNRQKGFEFLPPKKKKISQVVKVLSKVLEKNFFCSRTLSENFISAAYDDDDDEKNIRYLK
ncbi:hypothetical protein Phum_PHUM476090 [Pediculus humanus corporis]|uniref:Uncharacterized protein n=1 Tax=Pediculus humanus subsp. corporis TaxID=121224 RepID=E0VW90_PEDHC|nr:uncharacterized protein Phum_PHUM476090 [Pediculus humanus corporis]EEB17646.1 hypothetical protein Phum_PHUM476090 [Pediculus humanus corporis]